LVEVLVGTGGWYYFNVPGDRLRNYAKAFKTVEVNSTFYRIPPLSLVESWRRRVPEEFEFIPLSDKPLQPDISMGDRTPFGGCPSEAAPCS